MKRYLEKKGIHEKWDLGPLDKTPDPQTESWIRGQNLGFPTSDRTPDLQTGLKHEHLKMKNHSIIYEHLQTENP